MPGVMTYVKSLLKRIMLKSKLNSFRKYMLIGDSYMLTNFNLVTMNPALEKVYVVVGDDTMVDCNIIFESESGTVVIGNRSFIGQSNIICKSKIEFGDNVFVAWGCWFYDHDSHSLDYRERSNDISQQLADYRLSKEFIKNKNWTTVKSSPIKICSNSWIGMNCHILKGVTIGEGAVVGAGSVVTKDVQPWTVVAGNPASVIKKIPLEFQK